MDVIKILSEQEAQKIAAGEVVDRPANIVKELIENAIDAGSTKIDISILDGGKKCIQVSDNGCGMTTRDARASLIRHATSKITGIQDLEKLTTFGFRGEALASITSVTKGEIITKHASEDIATRLSVEAGKIVNEEPYAWTTGTRITLDDLFYNIPARKKFLRTSATETRLICHLFQALSLAHYDRQFSLLSEKKMVYQCGAAKNPLERYIQFSSAASKNEFLTLEQTESHNIKIHGFLSHHHAFRYDKNHIFFFVNNRLIKHYKLTNALLRGYQNVLPPRKYPVAAIFIELDPAEIDVNIHPRKEEIAFLHPQRVENMITDITKKTLGESITQPSPRTTVHFEEYPFPVSRHASFNPLQSFQFHESVSLPPQKVLQENVSKDEALSFLEGSENSPPPTSRHNDNESSEQLTAEINETYIKQQRDYILIGQFSLTYILIERGNQLIIVDAHAAHERILYEQFENTCKPRESVGLLFPTILEFNPSDIEILLTHEKLLEKNGIIIESFGPEKIIVTGTPLGLQNIHYKDFLKHIISLAYECDAEVDKKHAQNILTEKIRALMACKAAVKAGDMLSQQQMYALVDDLFKTSNRLTCPHGRPTTWVIQQDEIEKKFKRRL